MKRFLFSIVLLGALAACIPAVIDAQVRVETPVAPWTHAFSTTTTGVFVAASTTAIVAVEGPNCRMRNTVVGGPNSAVSCDAPGTFRLQTVGTVSTTVMAR